jgi:nitroreductase
MDVMTAIKGRRSIREFKAKKIEPRKIEALKQALIWAPSAGNLQSRRFYFVTNDDVKKGLVHAALGQSFIRDAPLVVVGCADLRIGRHYGVRGVNLYCIQDLAASIENMMLAATGLGLGSVWVGAFHKDEAARTLKLPEHLVPQAIVPVGYQGENPEPPERMGLNEAIVEIS